MRSTRASLRSGDSAVASTTIALLPTSTDTPRQILRQQRVPAPACMRPVVTDSVWDDPMRHLHSCYRLFLRHIRRLVLQAKESSCCSMLQ